MSDLLLGLLGGGSLVSLITAIMQYWQKQKGSDIDWYDRAVEQVQAQDKTIMKLREYIRQAEKKIKTLEDENEYLRDLIEELEDLVLDMEREKKSMIEEIQKYQRSEKKWRK